MDGKEVSRSGGDSSSAAQNEEEMDLRRGPWTEEEDLTLVNYISAHGEGRWNSLARCAGLKRTGKSCRLRWLNYLRPDVRRGNITLEEQLLILELHSRWGNRWSKIAQYFPGRTDNEIKNYWRTRVQKHAKQLKCDVNSKQFKDAMRYHWMPRLLERIQATTSSAAPIPSAASDYLYSNLGSLPPANFPSAIGADFGGMQINPQSYGTPENSSSSGASSSESFGSQFLPPLDMSDYSTFPASYNNNPGPDHCYLPSSSVGELPQPLIVSPSDCVNPGFNFPGGEQQSNQLWFEEGYESENLWNVDDIWLLQQQLSNNSL